MFYAFNLKKLLKYLKLFLIFFITVFLFINAIHILFPLNHLDIIYKYSKKYNIDTSLVCAVINAESRFKQNAVSEKGASGLMQIMKPTADWAAEEIGIKEYSYDKIFEPELNIHIGCWYLSRLMKQYDNNLTLVIAAYNAGSGNVSKWLYDTRYSQDGEQLNNIPFKETDKYVDKVNIYKKVYTQLLRLFGGKYE